MGPAQHRRHRLCHRPVVHRVGQAVRPPGGLEVQLEVQVHLEGLGPLALLREGTMNSENPKPSEFDSIRVSGVGSRLRAAHLAPKRLSGVAIQGGSHRHQLAA